MDVAYTFRDQRFTWNVDKAESNIRKHGVDFREAVEVFFDPGQEFLDATRSDEERGAILGYSRRSRILLVVYVERYSATRIISARAASRAEQEIYEQRFRYE